jgi:hypothetical protein
VKLASTDRGLVASGVAHAALLVAILVGFSSTKQFDDNQESVPVDMVTSQQFAEIMKGEKTAKEIQKQPTRVDKVDDITETHQAPPVADAKVNVPTPPPRLRRIPDPGQDDRPQQPPQQQAALPPQPPAPTPPPRPVTPPQADPKPLPPPRPDAEAATPPPPPKPKKVAVTPPPLPPTRPAPKDPPKQDDKLKLDEVAKLIDATKNKPASKPRSGDETADDTPRLNLADVSKLLSRDTPQQRASTGRSLSQVASLGSPTASAAKMSPSLAGQLDGWMVDRYKQCWSYLGLNSGEEYIPEIAVEFTPDGTLIGQPKLRNPPRDPNMRSLAESALRAVERCNPLNIPAQYAPYYDQWKSRVLRFDPEDMAG